MASRQDVVFVIVPGSFATPEMYEENLVAALRQKNRDVRVVELLSANDGTRRPPATMGEDATHIRSAVAAILDDCDKPANVVLTLHSYSGIPGSSALKGFSKVDRSSEGKETAVLGIVYMGSFLPLLDQSVRDIMGDAMPEPYKSGAPGDYMPPVPPEFAPLIFNDLASPAQIEKYQAMFTRHSSDSYDGKATYAAWKDIPSVQIIPGNDMIVPPPVQEAMYQTAFAAGAPVLRVFVEDAGHAVNVSQTDRVVSEMEKLAEEAK